MTGIIFVVRGSPFVIKSHNFWRFRMKNKIIIFIMLLTSLPAFAGDAERRELAGELLTLLKFDRNIEASFAAARQMQMAQLRTSPLPMADAATARDLREKTMDYLQQELSWKNLKDEFIGVYAEAFTEDQLHDLINFYKSPTGQAYIGKVPVLMARSAEITQKRMGTIAPEVQRMVHEAAEKQKAAIVIPSPEKPAPKPEPAK